MSDHIRRIIKQLQSVLDRAPHATFVRSEANSAMSVITELERDLEMATTNWQRCAKERDEAWKVVKRLRNMSAVEMMGENRNVKHHIENWESRCLKAEDEREWLLHRVKVLEAEVEYYRHRDPPTIHLHFGDSKCQNPH